MRWIQQKFPACINVPQKMCIPIIGEIFYSLIKVYKYIKYLINLLLNWVPLVNRTEPKDDNWTLQSYPIRDSDFSIILPIVMTNSILNLQANIIMKLEVIFLMQTRLRNQNRQKTINIYVCSEIIPKYIPGEMLTKPIFVVLQ
jgi:hypothetical protein